MDFLRRRWIKGISMKIQVVLFYQTYRSLTVIPQKSFKNPNELLTSNTQTWAKGPTQSYFNRGKSMLRLITHKPHTISKALHFEHKNTPPKVAVGLAFQCVICHFTAQTAVVLTSKRQNSDIIPVHRNLTLGYHKLSTIGIDCVPTNYFKHSFS